jgi:poly(3-hydroxybutyrate) depolymerase
MKIRWDVAAAVLLVGLTVLDAAAQAPPSLSLARVQYNTRKATVSPQGELKAQIDALDKEIAEAMRLGRSAEARRLFARGTALLAGEPWTDEADYAASLVLRSDRVVADSAHPYVARLEQLYAPTIGLERSLAAHATLRGRSSPDPVRDFGLFEGVSRDLRDSPYVFEFDLRDVPDGTYQLTAEVRDGARTLGSATLTVSVLKGLETMLARLEEAAAQAPASVRADLLFPGDRIRHVNRGRIELRTFDAKAEIFAADRLAAALKSGKEPYAGMTGDFERHYLLEPAGEIMPYRLYVPVGYTRAKPFPLIIALHGLGQTEDSFFEGYGKQLPALSEQRGYILAAPLGYRVDGFYGYTAIMGSDDAVRRRAALSEQDVLEVLKRVRADYNIDPARIYLMGHSMGAIGTWTLAAKHPDIWAALAPISGLGNPATVEQMRHIPQVVIHGDADPTVSVQGSRVMVEAMQKLGVEVKYIEVPGGNHINIAAPNFPAIFDFFDAHRKKAGGPTL